MLSAALGKLRQFFLHRASRLCKVSDGIHWSWVLSGRPRVDEASSVLLTALCFLLTPRLESFFFFLYSPLFFFLPSLPLFLLLHFLPLLSSFPSFLLSPALGRYRATSPALNLSFIHLFIVFLGRGLMQNWS